MQKNKGQSSWISLSDVMTGLMLVFLLIVVMLQDPTRCGSTKQKIHNALENIQQQKQSDYTIELPSDKDSCGLVISFPGEDRPLFEQDQAEPTTYFRDALKDFIPLYFEVLQANEIKDYIQEVRIEGHTAEYSRENSTDLKLVELSQARARAILQYLMFSKDFNDLEPSDKDRLKFKLMSAGFGKGRALDEEGRYCIESNCCSKSSYDATNCRGSNNKISDKSRRVEFRIVTGANHAIREVMQLR